MDDRPDPIFMENDLDEDYNYRFFLEIVRHYPPFISLKTWKQIVSKIGGYKHLLEDIALPLKRKKKS